MLLRLVLRLLANIVGLLVANHMIGGMHLSDDLKNAAMVSIVMLFVNFVVGKFLKTLSMVIIILTFGLFVFVVNGATLLVVSRLVGNLLIFDDFSSAVAAAIVLWVANTLANILTRK